MRKLIGALFGFSVILFTGQVVHAGCNVQAPAPAEARTFAVLNTQGHWKEYKNIEAVPEIDTNGGESAQFWREKDGGSSVYTVDPGEDFWTYTRYCFDSTGQLSQVGFEVRTAWGWGYSLEGPVVEAVFLPKSTRFFSTENGKPIPRPDGASDVPNALRPVLYLRLTKLPFAQLLSGSPTATRK